MVSNRSENGLVRTCILISAILTFIYIICFPVVSILLDLYTYQTNTLMLITLFIPICTFVLCYLGGHIIRGNKGAVRLSIILAVIWLICSFLYASSEWDDDLLPVFLVIGLVPLISYFGLLWSINGFLSDKKPKESLQSASPKTNSTTLVNVDTESTLEMEKPEVDIDINLPSKNQAESSNDEPVRNRTKPTNKWIDGSKKLFGAAFITILFLVLIGIGGQCGRELGKKTFVSEEEIEIKRITDLYAEASRKMTHVYSDFTKTDQEAGTAIAQEDNERVLELFKKSKKLLTEAMKVTNDHEDIRIKGSNYLEQHKEAFDSSSYDFMYFSFNAPEISTCNKAFIEFGSNYIELLDYLILNFDSISSSQLPDDSLFVKMADKNEKLIQKYTEAYQKKINAMKKEIGEDETNRLLKELQE